ncbi:MAG: HlyD family type I secretion periplasmic adaptor subunit [Leptolyngbyaceae cyanobacterium MO_188.B28]|nr:HlyD family type I secretion periplasmic adaptor subunit [Leptolyngbyaceae cyanobacterium MO_188.B28]
MPPLLLASITSAAAISKPPDLAVSRLASNPAPIEQPSHQPNHIGAPTPQSLPVSSPEWLKVGPGIGPRLSKIHPNRAGLTAASSTSNSQVALQRYIVQPGDTIWEIAQRHNLSAQAILAANPGVEPKRLQINQTLTLPLFDDADGALAPEQFRRHVVRAGETIWEIAQDYNLSFQAMLAANPGVNPQKLHVGQILMAPIPRSQSAESMVASAPTPEPDSQPAFTPPVAAQENVEKTPDPAAQPPDARIHQLDWIVGHGPKLGISAAIGAAALLAFWYWRRELAYAGVASPDLIASAPPTSFQPESKTEATATATTLETAAWSSFMQTVLDQPPSSLPHRWLSGGVVFCLVFGAWAWVGKIEEIGRAQGQLAPQGNVYKVEFVDLGKVSNIVVEEGQQVEAGQVLVELDTQTAAAEVARLQQTLAALQTKLEQQQALIAKTRLEAESRAAIAQADYQAQAVAISQSEARAQTAQTLITQLEGDADAHKVRLERLKPLLEAGAISREEVFGAEQTLRERQRAITQSAGEQRQALGEAERLRAGLAQKQAEGQRAQLQAQQEIQQLEAEATQISAKIDETNNLLDIANVELERRHLRAPVTGVLLSLEVDHVGEVVEPGETIAEIAPLDAPLVLAAKLPNQEAGFIEAGMPVQVKMDAYPYQDFGVVSGRVTAISPDAEIDERLGKVYEVEIALERDHVATPDQLIHFKPGQTASADIIIRHRRIADVLLDPIRQLQQDGINL